MASTPAPQAAAVATNALQAVVFAEILKPMSASLGPIGDVVTESVAARFFVRPVQ